MAEKAIGILFEVMGEGNISGESGSRIKKQLTDIVDALHKDSVTKLKFQIDSNFFKREIDTLKKQLKELSGEPATSVTVGVSENTSAAKGGIDALTKAKKAISEYYSLKTQYERKASRTSNVDKEYKELSEAVRKAEKEAAAYYNDGVIKAEKLKESISGISEEQRNVLEAFAKSKDVQYQTSNTDINKNAEAAWGNLTQKVHNYIDSVEYSASRDKKAAASLDKLRQMANNTDYHGYDALKKKLAEVEQYINKNSLATETWGQKMLKTFGSRVRSALAGILTAKIGQYIKNVYDNVVKLDAAVVDLQIATGMNRKETQKLVASYSELGKQLGATTAEVAKSADTWLRQGHSIEETNKLIESTMMLSKLGQIESAEASTALTSALKGYKLEASDAMSAIDKFTSVDMVSATSAGGIATAMAETATSADIAGVSMDKLIGYIATVSEVTQDGAESVGTFYKTLFARMNSVAAGEFVDEETGESLNDVETVLNELGIALRDTNGVFRSSADVLDEVAARWNNFNNVQQHAIATAFAGTRQQEKFAVLMENYGTAAEYAGIATESAGTAQEKYAAYTESLDGKMATLTATFEQLSMTVLDADWIITGVEMLTGIVNALESIASVGDGAIVAIVAMAAVIVTLIAASDLASVAIKKMIDRHKELAIAQGVATGTTATFGQALFHMSSTGIVGVITLIPRLIIAIAKYVAGAWLGVGATKTFSAALNALNINPVMLAITALVGVIVGAVAAIKNYQEEAANTAKQTENVINSTIEVTKKLEKERDTLDDLISSYRDLAEANKGVYDTETREEILEIQKQIVDLVGDEASSLDLVNAGYNNLKGTLKELYSLSLTQSKTSVAELHENIRIINDEIKKLTDASFYYGPGNAETKLDIYGYGFEVRDNRTMLIADSLEDYIETLKRAKSEIESLERTPEFTKKFYDEISKRLSALETYAAVLQVHFDAMLDSVVSVADYSIKSGATIEGVTINGSGIEDGAIDSIQEYIDYKNALIGAAKASQDLKDANGNALVDEGAIVSFVELYMIENYGNVYDELANSIWRSNYQLKGFSKLSSEVKQEWEALSNGFDEMAERGALTLDTIGELLELFPDLENVELEDGSKFLERTADGYFKLNGSLEDYISLKQEELLAIMASNDYLDENGERSEAYKNAEQELNDLLTIFNTLSLEAEIEEATKKLEGQLEKFEEIVDLRKELLETYQDELRYQNELQKKQKAVTDLETKLAISKLDDSASGRARTRELTLELAEAQEELEEFTLEHAIDVLVDQLEYQKQEYKTLIEEEIALLSSTATATSNTESLIANYLAKADAEAKFNSAVNALRDFVTTNQVESGGSNLSGDKKKTFDTLVGHVVSASNQKSKADGDGSKPLNNRGVLDLMSGAWYVKPEEKQKAPNGFSYVPGVSKHADSGKITTSKGYNFTLELNGAEYNLQSSGKTLGAEDSANAKKTVELAGVSLAEGTVIKKNGTPYVYTSDGSWVKPEVRASSYKDHMQNFVNSISQYHTGGFVGGKSGLRSNEEFAKLFKGEFVSTPSQMRNFMENILPQIASFESSGVNEFNAPLIEIVCENVTSDSLPKLEAIVGEAVKEIQKQLDSGMSRTGYKRSVKSF